MAKVEKIEVPKEEYERLRDAYERQHARSGRMSLRIPSDLWKRLVDRADSTGLGKTKIILAALEAHLSPGKASAKKSELFD